MRTHSRARTQIRLPYVRAFVSRLLRFYAFVLVFTIINEMCKIKKDKNFGVGRRFGEAVNRMR